MKKLLLMIMLILGVGYAQAQTIRNSNNSVLGRVNSDGTVRNANNSVMGYAKDVPMRYAAIYFFFNLM